MYPFDVEDELDRIIKWLNRYKEKTSCRGVVLGLSGGKDSTVVAMLAKKVWGDDVVALLMPNGEQKDIDDSYNIAQALGLRHYEVNIGTVYNNLIHNIENQLVCKAIGHEGESDWAENCPKVTDKAKTNIPPRIRMTTLYAVAQTLGYRVIGTGNASEAHIGWTTKFGDSACDFNPIAHLTCSNVIALGKLLAKEFGLESKFIAKTPSDGLCGKSDEESFGFSYATLDDEIDGVESLVDRPQPQTLKKIHEMHKISEHKRRMPYTVKDDKF